MLPVRVALNVAYAVLVTGLNSEEREALDGQIYGLTEVNEAANRRLQREIRSGSED